jgi:alpha-tubulin suppressor-like RCC1 family protein
MTKVKSETVNTGRLSVISVVFFLVAMVGIIGLVGPAAPALAAATSPGQLYGFGANEFGQLGNAVGNLSPEAHPLPEPVDLPGESGPVTRIAAGSEHSLAVTSTGQLYSFGENASGQLGTTTNSGTPKANPVPTLVSLPSGSPPVTEVAAGSSFSLAVTATGQLYGFGENQFGQLGNTTNNSSGAANPTPTPVILPAATGPVTEVAAGAFFSLAVTSTGQLFSFGANDRGQLGSPTNSGTITPNPTPTLVNLPSGSGAVTEIAAGYRFALALTSSGRLYGFGENQFGQLGSTFDNGSSAANPTPEQVSLPGESGPVTQIAAGNGHSLALTATGQLYAFGENRYGQLGSEVNNGSYAANPTPTAVALPGATGPVIGIAAGLYSSLALTATGQLYGFGENRFGQLGDTHESGVYEGANPTPTLADLPAGTTIGSVASGPLASHALAVVSDLAVTTSALPAGLLGVPYGATAQASGGTAPYRWTAGGLPAGLGIDSATGQITGTPTATPTSAVTLSVTDAEGTTASATLPLTIPPASAASATNPAVSAVAVHTCRVPKLKGEKLKAAKKRIKAADCKLGKVSKEGTAGRRAEVVKQKPKVGTTRPAGSKINVVLGGK